MKANQNDLNNNENAIVWAKCYLTTCQLAKTMKVHNQDFTWVFKNNFKQRDSTETFVYAIPWLFFNIGRCCFMTEQKSR